jgi:hypothetical protein
MAGDSNEGDGRKPDSQLALQIHSLLKNAEEALEEGNLVKALVLLILAILAGWWFLTNYFGL